MPFETCEATAVHTSSDGRHSDNLVREAYNNGDIHSYSQAQIQAMHRVTSDVGLPGIHLFDSDGQHDGIISGALRIGGNLLQGAAEEVVNHPDRLLTNLAIGAAVGAIAVIASPVVLAAGAAAGVAIGAGFVGMELANGNNPLEGVGDFFEDCGVVANPDGHTAYEIERAEENVQAGGGVMLEVAAGAVAGNYGGAAMNAYRAGSMAAIETTVMRDALEAPAQRLLLTGPETIGAQAEVTALQGVERTALSGSAGAEGVESAIVRASNVGDDVVAQGPRTYDGQIGTSAAPGFDPAHRLEGQAFLDRIQVEARLSGYTRGAEQFAVRNLEDPVDVQTFVRALEERYHPAQIYHYLNNKVFSGNRVVNGTESAWEGELARLRTVLTDSGVDAAELPAVRSLPRPAASQSARTSAWEQRAGSRTNPQTGEDLIRVLQAEAEATEFGLDWGTYAIRNLRNHQEIQDFVQAVSMRHPGQEADLFKALMRDLETPTGPGFAAGTREAWLFALRNLHPESAANLI